GEGALEGIAEELEEGLSGGEAFLYGGLGEVETELGGGEVEVGPGGVGLAQQGGDDHEQQRSSGEDALAQDELAVAGEPVEVLIQAGLEAGGHGPYNVHGWLLVHTSRLVATSAELGATRPLKHSSLAKLCLWAALKANPPEHDAWYGYAEFCLFLGQEDEYCLARHALLQRFSAATDPQTAERTALACLLLPSSGEELRLAVALAE